jgi:NAD(P)H-dependent FMN reductase
MSVRWFTETVAAWSAVCLTAGGGIITTAVHYGSTNQQIAALAQKQTATEAHVEKHDDQLSTIQQQSAANAQKLQDIVDTVHDIQLQVHQHDDHR